MKIRGFQLDGRNRFRSACRCAADWLGRPEGIALSIVLIVALGVRLWGAYFDLPHIFHADEPFEVNRAVRLGMGGFDFERWAKGGYFYILFIEYGIYFVWSYIIGAISGVSEFAELYVTDPSPFWKIGRVTTALIGTAAVWLVWWQGRRIAGQAAGLASAMFLALSFEHVVSSHYITVDVPGAFFAFWALMMVVEDVEGRRKLRVYEFGPVAAFAVMCKIPMVLLFVPYFLGSFFRGGVRGAGGLFSITTWAPVLLAGILYLTFNPGVLLHTDQIIGLLRSTLGTEVSLGAPAEDIYAGAEQNLNLWLYYTRIFIDSQGIALIAAMFLGSIISIINYRRAAIIHLLFCVLLFIAIAGSTTNNLFYSRYIVPILPGLCLMAGIGLASALDWVRTYLSFEKRVAGLVALLFGIMLVIEPARSVVQFDQYKSRDNPRAQMLRWVEQNIPSGSKILLQGNPEADSALSIPLSNTPSNIQTMISQLEDMDPGKAFYWKIRLKHLKGPFYDLKTVRHFENWGSLSKYQVENVEYVILRRRLFAPESEASSKGRAEWDETRRAFYAELQSDEANQLIAEFFDPIDFRSQSWHLEIWRLSSASGNP